MKIKIIVGQAAAGNPILSRKLPCGHFVRMPVIEGALIGHSVPAASKWLKNYDPKICNQCKTK